MFAWVGVLSSFRDLGGTLAHRHMIMLVHPVTPPPTWAHLLWCVQSEAAVGRRKQWFSSTVVGWEAP
jgi:hypothetical protein